MRVRTDEKRQEIIRIAAQLFEEQGFDQASMSLISQKVGGSKATLYGYFRSKEELFLAVIDNEIQTNIEGILGTMLNEPDLSEGLVNVATAYLMQRLSVRPTRFFRMVAAQSRDSDLGAHFYKHVLKPAWMIMCGKFEEFMAEGRVRRADPWDMTMHFKGLCDYDLVEQRLLGVIRRPDPAHCRAIAERAVEAFMRIYGPDTPPATKRRKVPSRTVRKAGQKSAAIVIE
jgi:AcrR family transcriptional regulator